MRAMFRTLHFRGQSTPSQMDRVFCLHGATVLVREEGNKMRKIRSMLGKQGDGVGI